MNTIAGQPLSTCEAEKSAEALALARAMGFKDLLNQIDMPQPERIDAWGDNKIAVDLSNDAHSHERSRHFSTKIEFCKAVCDPEDGQFFERHVATAHNPTDYLGKLVDANKYKQSVRYLANTDNQVPPTEAHKDQLAKEMAA